MYDYDSIVQSCIRVNFLLTCNVNGRTGKQQKYQKTGNQCTAALLSVAQFSSRESNIGIR